MAQSNNDAATSKKETTTVSKDAGTTQNADAPATKAHKCKPGCKSTCCAKKDTKSCAPGCKKACCSKADADHKHKAGEKHACAPDCTKDCCAAKKKK